MRECNGIQDDLKAYLDGQLPLAARLTVGQHLLRCASCREEIREMKRISKEFRLGEAGALDPGLRARILSGLPEGLPDTPEGAPSPIRRRRPMLLWGAASAGVLTWFLFYPAITTLQQRLATRRTAGVNAPGSSTVQLNALSQYTQDYDGTMQGQANTKSPPAAEQYRYTLRQGAGRAVAKSMPTTVTKLPDDQPAHGAEGAKSPSDSAGADQTILFEQDSPQNAGQAQKKVAEVQTGSGRIQKKVKQDIAFNPSWANKNGADMGFQPEQGRRFQPATIPDTEATLGIGLILPTERVVHREASITVQVANVEQGSENVERIVTESGGYVANNQLTTGDDDLQSASLTLKVPVKQFDTILKQLTQLGALKAKSLSGEDLTEKVSDEEQTSKVLKEDIASTETKLRATRNRRQEAHDEETLRQLRTRKAQSQARLQMLNKLGALATVSVDLQEKPKTQAPPLPKAGGIMGEMSDTAQAAAHSFLMALRLPVQLLVWIVVYAPIWGLLMIAYRRAARA